MKIIENRFTNDINMCFGVYHLNDLIKDENVREYAKGMTLFYINKIIEISKTKDIRIFDGNSIDKILNDAADSGYDYILLQSIGNLLYKTNIIFEIEEFIKNNNFGYAGHILHWSDEKYYELHPQFCIINLKSYVQSNRPKFGDWTPGEELLADVERSVDNFHDHYTPLWVKYKGTKSIQKHTQRGWSLISSLLENGFNCITLPMNIRDKKLNLYFEHKPEVLINAMKTLNFNGLDNPNQFKIVHHNFTMLKNIWLFNSEDMLITNKGKFDIVAFPASGLKMISVLRDDKLNENATMVIYDFNEESLRWIQFFKNYEGENLLNCIDSFDGNGYFKWLGNTTFGNFVKDNAFYENFKNSMDFFGGEDKFIEYWRTFKKMDVKFIKTNLIEERDELMKIYKEKEGRKYIHISNIFSNDLTISLYGLRGLFNKMNDFLLECYLVDTEFEVSLFDFINRYKDGKIKDIINI
jgi:hypothetical protein